MQRSLAVAGLVLLLGAGLALPPRALAERTHRVRPGETPAQIAHRYGVSTSDLLAANELGRAGRIRAGQTLVVPDRGVAYVGRGDTLSEIARRHRCSIGDLTRLNRLRPNATLRVGQRLVLPGHVPEWDPRDWGEPEEPGVVTLVRGERRVRVRLVDGDSRVQREGLEALSGILRRDDEPADASRDVDPRLALLLAMLSDQFGGRPITVVSGFRDAERYTEESSRHVASSAADIRIAGVPYRAIWERCRRVRGVGCGFYPNSVFVHVDVRDRRTQWVDWSGPGERPRYGTLLGPARRGHRGMPFPRADAIVPGEVVVVGGAATARRPSPPGGRQERLNAPRLDQEEDEIEQPVGHEEEEHRAENTIAPAAAPLPVADRPVEARPEDVAH
jgi:LysM repeat protein